MSSKKPTYGSAVVLNDITNQTEEEWVAGRSEYIGASEVAAVVGVSPYDTPLDIWCRKTGRARPIESNYRMKRGNHMEPFILEELARDEGLDLDPAPYRLQHPDHPFICVNLDGWCRMDEVPLEIKATSSYNRRALQDLEQGDIKSNSSVECWYYQVHTHMLVTGAPFAWLAADCDGKMYAIRIPRDSNLCNMIEQCLVEFWTEYVETDEMPQYSQARIDTLRGLYKIEDKEVVVEADDELAKALKERHKYHEKAKECWNKRDELDARILELSGGAKRIKAPGVSATRVVTSYKSFDSKRFKRDNPELYRKYKTNTVEKDYFLVKAKG